MFKGTARCRIIDAEPHIGGTRPDLPSGCTHRVVPYGVPADTPDATAPECLVELYTKTDRLAELEDYEGILYLFDYGEV